MSMVRTFLIFDVVEIGGVGGVKTKLEGRRNDAVEHATAVDVCVGGD